MSFKANLKRGKCFMGLCLIKMDKYMKDSLLMD